MVTNLVLSLVVAALVAVENSPVDRGDGNRGRGPLQIHRCVIDDVNRIHGMKFRRADAEDPVKARTICRLYLEYYGSPARLGRPPTARELGRIWNGGPRGLRKPGTRAYGQRVQKAYDALLKKRMRTVTASDA